MYQGGIRLQGSRVGEHVYQGVGVGVGEGHVQRLVAAADLDGVRYLVGQLRHLFGDFLHQRRPLILVLQILGSLDYLVDVPLAVKWHPYQAGMFGQGLEDRLPHPPDGVGNELEPAGLVEPFGRLDQTQVALTDQIFQRPPLTLELLGHTDHESQVGDDQLVLGLAISLLDQLGKLDLLPGVQRLELADISQVVA